MAVLVPVARLARQCNPFAVEVWGKRVTRAAVRQALKERRLVTTPGTDDHAGRIAFLVENPANDAIEVDVGIPALGYQPPWMVTDGNHRLAAAIFAGRAFIPADIGGQIDYAEQIFSIIIP